MLDYLRTLLSLIFAICVMYMLLDCEIKHKKKLYQLGVYITLALCCNMYVLLSFGYTHFMKLYPLLVHLPVFLAFVFISKFKMIKVFFVLLTLVAMTTSFSVVGLIVSYFFDSSREIVNMVCFILYLPTGFLVYKYLRPPLLYMLRNTDKGWLGFCIIPLSYSIIIYSVAMYDLDKVIIGTMINNAALLFILAFSAYFLIFRYFVQTREQFLLQNEQTLLQMQVTAAQTHLEELKESQEKTILYRHDMRHHLNLINSYIADNNKEAAQAYIAEVENRIERTVVEHYCSNYAVNLILYSYIAKAKNDQISVEIQVDLPMKNTVTDTDLCVIFANTIENAINACKLVFDVKDRTIKILCKKNGEKLFIQITNSYEGKVMFANDMPVSSEEYHRLGTKSIMAVVQKYNGTYSSTTEEGIFKTSILL